MGFEVNISYGDCAVTQKAKLPLHVQLLEEEDAVAGAVHGVPESKEQDGHGEKKPQKSRRLKWGHQARATASRFFLLTVPAH